MKNLAKRIGLLLVSGLVMHGSILACSDGDSETIACAGPGTGGAGGSGTSTTATGSASTSGSGSATTGSTSAASSSASTGSGGSNACGCAQPMTYDIQCALVPSQSPFPPTWIATLTIAGRSQQSLLGTTAVAAPVGNESPIVDGLPIDFKSVGVVFRGDNVLVSCQGAQNGPAAYQIVKFLVPSN